MQGSHVNNFALLWSHFLGIIFDFVITNNRGITFIIQQMEDSMKYFSFCLILTLLAMVGCSKESPFEAQPQQDKELIRSYFNSLSGKDKPAEVVNRYVADSDEELKQHVAFFEAAFPQYELIAEDMIAEGDKVAVRAIFKGTHKGDLMGIAPTGKQVTLPFIIVYRIAGDKIVEHWMSVDQLSLMQQLGVVPKM